jgi:hypothetical protein
LLLYGLISSPLNETPRLVAFIMGAVHAINAAFILAIARHVIRPPGAGERWALIAVAWLMGVSGAGFNSLLGTSSNDLTSSLFVLGSLLALLKVADPADGGGHWRGFAAGGLAAGLGIGLKNTSAIYAPGLGILLLVVALRRKSLSGFLAFGLAACLGFFALDAHHMLTLWNDFGNPFFPYMNQIFRSPWWEPEGILDERFPVRSLWELIAFPFYWTKVTRYVVVELPFRDWRAAIAYIAMVLGVLAFAISWFRGRRQNAAGQTHGLWLVYVFVVVSYVTWAIGFGYYRYAMPLEMLTGVVTVGALIWLISNNRLRVLGAVVVLAIAASTTVYLDWGHLPYTDRYVDVQVPRIPPDAVVLIATGQPAAYFIPWAEPRAQYVGIENNYLEIKQTNKLATRVKELMRAPGRPKFVLSLGDFDAAKLNTLLANFGLRLSPAPCAPIHSNLEVEPLALCQAVPQ